MFEVPPDMLDRMEMIGLKSGLRIDLFNLIGEALRVICKRCGDIEPEVFAFLNSPYATGAKKV